MSGGPILPSGARVLAPAPEGPVAPLASPPTFTVVICAYQAAGTVADAVRSALAQTHPPHEVIVVDDGSTDDITGALAPFTGRITLVRKPNGGGASALNAGAAAASGDFLATLDADDVYHPQRLQVLAELATVRPDLDLVTTDARFVAGGQPVGRFTAHTPFAVRDQRAAIFESCFVGGWPAVRLSRLRAVGGFDERVVTAYDWDCWLRLILAGARAGLADVPHYDYRLHDGSLAADRLRALWDRVRLLEKAREDPALRPEDRPLLTRALRGHRSRAVLAETQATLARRPAVEGRRRLLRLALAGGVRPRARLAAVLGATAPPLGRRLAGVDTPPNRRFGEG